MKFLIYIYSLFFTTNLFAQNKNAQWVFGDSAGIDFLNMSNPTPFHSGMDGRGSCVAISDSNGNLRFYAYSQVSLLLTKVFNNNNVHMLNSAQMQGAGSYNEMVIITIPKSQNEYYLFYTGARSFIDTVYFATIDMTLDNGLGDVTIKNSVLGAYRSGDCLTAVKHGNGRDWWVVSKLSDINGTQHNRFFVYLVTSDSIYPPLIQDFNDATDADFQKVIWHPSGNKFMLINVGGYMAEFDFNRCSGIITLIRTIYSQQTSNYNRFFWEGAYSPNGNVFYTCLARYPGFTNTGYLIQYDLLATNIPSSADTLDSFQPPIGDGAVRLAPDSKIYFTHSYQSLTAQNYPYPDSMRNYINENLSVINSPDSLGSSCDYQLFNFYLGGKRTYWGLPNNPNYDLGPLVGSMCDTLTIGIESNSPNKKISSYPNPFLDKIKFEYIIYDDYHIVVTDVLGKKVYEASRQDKPELDLSFLKQGLYFVTISDTKNVYQTKIIKQ